MPILSLLLVTRIMLIAVSTWSPIIILSRRLLIMWYRLRLYKFLHLKYLPLINPCTSLLDNYSATILGPLARWLNYHSIATLICSINNYPTSFLPFFLSSLDWIISVDLQDHWLFLSHHHSAIKPVQWIFNFIYFLISWLV